MRKLEVERDDAKTSLLKEAMEYLEEQNWVTLLQDIGISFVVLDPMLKLSKLVICSLI
jgi:hypothetical protein